MSRVCLLFFFLQDLALTKNSPFKKRFRVVLRAFTLQNKAGVSSKFSSKYEEVIHSITKNLEDEEYTLIALSFINTFVLTPEDVQTRESIRKEFLSAGIEKALKQAREHQIQNKIDRG